MTSRTKADWLKWECWRAAGQAAAASVLLLASARASELANVPVLQETKRARILAGEDAGVLEAFSVRPERVRTLFVEALLRWTGKTSTREAWLTLVSSNDVVGIKVVSTPGAVTGTRPSVTAVVVETLLEAGLPRNQILVWDKRLSDLRQAGYFELADRYGIQIAGSAEAGYDETVFYESSILGRLVWGDFEFGKQGDGVGRRSYVSKLVSRRITRHISLPPLLNHNFAGATGHLYSLAMGSVDNTLRFEGDVDRLAVAVAEIFALPVLADRVALCITDALIAQYYGEEQSLLHYASPIRQLWFSRDPVALDVWANQEMEKLRQKAKAPRARPKMDLYQNAALLELGIADPKMIEVEVMK